MLEITKETGSALGIRRVTQLHRKYVLNLRLHRNISPRRLAKSTFLMSEGAGQLTFGLSVEIWQNNFTDGRPVFWIFKG
jgi:hypothetical protein